MIPSRSALLEWNHFSAVFLLAVAGDNRTALLVVRYRAANFSSRPESKEIAEEMSRAFRELYMENGADRWFVPFAAACRSLIVPAVTDTPDSAQPVRSRAPPMRTSVVGRPR